MGIEDVVRELAALTISPQNTWWVLGVVTGPNTVRTEREVSRCRWASSRRRHQFIVNGSGQFLSMARKNFPRRCRSLRSGVRAEPPVDLHFRETGGRGSERTVARHEILKLGTERRWCSWRSPTIGVLSTGVISCRAQSTLSHSHPRRRGGNHVAATSIAFIDEGDLTRMDLYQSRAQQRLHDLVTPTWSSEGCRVASVSLRRAAPMTGHRQTHW